MMISLAELAHILGETCTTSGTETFHAVCTDSRSDCRNKLFIALSGPNFDGHNFVMQALTAGATGALVARTWQPPDGVLHAHLPLIQVTEPLQALAAFATAWRARFTLPVIAIVGSNGKTTTKEMVASSLVAHYGPEHVLATEENFNNAIGVPLTVLRMRSQHQAAVVEIGMNHPGETLPLAKILQPTIALILNAQREHQEFMINVAQVACEHAQIMLALPKDGIAILNSDDPRFEYWREQAKQAQIQTRTFALIPQHHESEITSDQATLATAAASLHDVTGNEIPYPQAHPKEFSGTQLALQTWQGEITLDLATIGECNMRNALAATTAALVAGVHLKNIYHGLAAFQAVSGRLSRTQTLSGVQLIDDSYNANPDSVLAGIAVLAAMPGHQILVLGDMAETGEQAGQYHDEIGGYAKSMGIDQLFAIGNYTVASVGTFGAGAHHFSNMNELIHALQTELGKCSSDNPMSILVKGSRSMGMERVVAKLSKPETHSYPKKGKTHAT